MCNNPVTLGGQKAFDHFIESLKAEKQCGRETGMGKEEIHASTFKTHIKYDAV